MDIRKEFLHHLNVIGWSQKKASSYLGLTPVHLSYLLSGKRSLTAANALLFKYFITYGPLASLHER